jgi:glycosyltransferase involved in cell wall biosynthesis
MIRVIIDGCVYQRNPRGGIARYWTETLTALERRREQVRCDVVVGGQARREGGKPSLADGSLRARLTAWRSDIFHSTYYTTWPRLRKPSVVTVYDLIDAELPRWHPNGQGFVARQLGVVREAAAVIAISQSTRALVRQWAGVEDARLFVAPPAVAPTFAGALPARAEIAAFRQRQTGGAPYLLHVGRRGNYKNAFAILQSFGQAAARCDRHLLFIGGSPAFSPAESAAIAAARVAERVHLVSQAGDDLLRLAYAGADAYVSASLMEGFGLPVIEAQACGTGLLLSDIPAYREIAPERAVFVAPTDIDAWAAAMASEIAVEPHWRADVLRRYTWEATAQAHVAAYAHAIRR